MNTRRDAPWLALTLLTAIATVGFVDRIVMNVLAVPVKAEFGLSDTQIGLLTGLAFAVLNVTLGIAVARYAERGRRIPLIAVGTALWSLATAACGFVGNFAQLLLARVGVGVGEAVGLPANQSVIADYFPPEHRTKALGFFMMSATAGLVLGMALGGFIAQNYGWRWAFIAVGLPGLLLALLTWFGLKEPRVLPQFKVRAEDQEGIWQAASALMAKPSYLHLVIAMVLYFLMAYGALVFLTPFVIRVHHLTVGEAGSGARIVLLGEEAGAVVARGALRADETHPGWLARVLAAPAPAREGDGALPVSILLRAIDPPEISRLRDRTKAEFERREGTKLSFMPFFAVAAIEALKAHPVVNASIDGDQVTYHGAEHLGVAVDTEKGLLVPVIKNAGDLNIAGIARAIADLADRTRNNKITPDELGGGTFTLTNTGSRGALFDTPIINQPQVAILGTGSVVKRAVVIDDPNLGETIAVRNMVYLALTYDHRLVDGADAARFLSEVKQRLESGQFEV